MSWPLFAVIQFAAFAAAALGALWLRNRRLQKRNEELLTLCARAHEELTALTAGLEKIETTAPPEKMLAERIKALTGDDPLVQVRRLVLENEIKAKADFAEQLAQRLAPDEPPDEEEFARRWRAIRQECQQLAMFLVADDPSCKTQIEQLFEVIAPLDQAYNVELAPLDMHATATADEKAAEAGGGNPEPAAADGEPAAGTAQDSGSDSEAAEDGADDGEDLDQAALDALLDANRKAGAGA